LKFHSVNGIDLYNILRS